VEVVRQYERESNFGGELKELLIQVLLFWEAMVLHLKIEAVLPKDVAVAPSECAGMFPVINL
jgi:hypothetical protein